GAPRRTTAAHPDRALPAHHRPPSREARPVLLSRRGTAGAPRAVGAPPTPEAIRRTQCARHAGDITRVRSTTTQRRDDMKTRRLAAAVAGGIASVMVLSACGASADPGGSGDGGTDGVTIDVLAVNLPAQEDLVKLTEEHFTKKTGIKVNFTLLPENDVRAKITQEFSSQAGVYDIATLSNYEIPFYADNGWVTSLDKYLKEDAELI